MIEALRTIVALNQDLIFFVYGLAFFVLGLSIALQSRNASRLDLARALSWLAAFGFAHGLHEWGEYFIPIQAAYMSPQAIEVLQGLRLLLLGLSFACLIEFGIRLLGTSERIRRLTVLNAGWFAVWLFLTFFPIHRLASGDAWHNIADGLARYTMALPGAMLAGFALRRHTLERIAPLNVPQIVSMLRVAGLTLVAYGFVAGLVPPPVPFFPGNLLNSQVFEAILIVPTAVPRTILGLILAITTIRALEVFDLEIERRLARMEEASLIQTEHDRIARELHDGAIQKVYTAGLLVESLRRWVPAEGDASTRVERAVSALNDAIADLRQNLRELSPTAPRQPLAERLRLLSEDPRFASLIRLTTDLELPADSVGELGQADHVVAIATEALSNTIRHAHASRVRLTARLTDGQLALTIEDDGIGLPKDAAFGFGLRNMRDRARLLAGELSLQNRTEGGTRVVLVVPWVPP